MQLSSMFSLAKLLVLVAVAVSPLLHTAAAGPLRVAYLGKEGTPAPDRCHVLMQELGRDAIWFDYSATPAHVTAEWLGRFDAILLDAPREEFPALAGIDGKRVVIADVASDHRDWSKPGFLKSLREQLLAAAGAARHKEWQAFLAQREPEIRRPDPNIANYERRPEPVTFQEAFSVKGSMERTQTPPDMRLELFASDPDIGKPIALAWDERGRCWVAETSDYPHDVNAAGEGNDRITICEDTNGDGKADKFTVFADKLNIPTSLVLVRGGAIVAQPPRFLFLKDTNGDDKADVREVIMEGWGIGDTHAQASSLHYGLDNWLYGCVGYSGFKGAVGGVTRDFRMGTYRFKADGSALEFLHQFTNNAWGHGTNAAGDQFGGTANGAPLFYGGIPASLVPAGFRAMTAKKINVEDKAHAITPNFRQVDVFGGYTSAAGSAFIYSGNLPPRLQGHVLICEPTMKLIALMDVQPDGAGYVAKDAFNLVASSDEWMSPVFAEVGPDGAVWFADWQNFIIQHNPTPNRGRGGYDAKTGVGGAHENPLRDHQRGRIYRVVWEKAGKPAITSLHGAGAAELVAALGSDNPFWRSTAQRLLVEGRPAGAVEPLKKLVAANDGGSGAVHALWTLHGLGQLDDTAHQAALSAKDPALRRNAIRALPADARGQRLLFGSASISDADPHTRTAAILKLAELPTSEELKTVAVQIRRDKQVQSDEWLREASKVLARKHEAQLYQEGPNLLPNPGFEITGPDGLPKDWKQRDYGRRQGNARARWEVLTGPGDAHSGSRGVRCITYGDGDTSLHTDVALKPETEYRLSGWIKTHAFRGRASLNLHGTRHETERVTARDGDWSLVETVFHSGAATTASVNILHVGQGDSYFDDVKLCEVTPAGEEPALTGDAKRGAEIFYKHATASCVLCHAVKGQGSAVGPPLDGLATKFPPAYIEESLLEPNKVLAKGYEALGASPMPPLGLILKPQEIEDIKAFLQTLK